jgi:hypothetical protein
MNDDTIYSIQDIQEDIIGEYKAILQYEEHLSYAENPAVVKILSSIIEEEKTHVGELIYLIGLLSGNQEQDLDFIIDGFNESYDLLSECIELYEKKNRLIESSQEAKQIAETIFQQLGGNKIATMIGMKNRTYDDSGAMFRFSAKAMNKSNYCKIEYNYGSDDYTMIFGKIYGNDYKVIDTIEGLYAEDLEKVFGEKTGLATRLF